MLGMGSLFGSMEGFITPLFDFAVDLNISIPKPILTLLTCVVSFLVGLIFCLDTGYYWVDIFNEYAVNLPLLILGLLQIVICCWVFGIKNWMKLLDEMLGSPKDYNFIDRCLYYSRLPIRLKHRMTCLDTKHNWYPSALFLHDIPVCQSFCAYRRFHWSHLPDGRSKWLHVRSVELDERFHNRRALQHRRNNCHNFTASRSNCDNSCIRLSLCIRVEA